MKLEFFWTDFRKICKYQILCKAVSGSRIIPCGQTSRLTDMTKLTANARNFENAPKMGKAPRKFILFDVTPCSTEATYLTFGCFLYNHDIFIHFYAEDIGNTSLFSK